MSKRVGIVVPTLGRRPEYLEQCLTSIRQAGNKEGSAHIVLVAPETFDAGSLLRAGKVDQLVSDPGQGLAEAINLGIRSMAEELEYVNWLGDDDLLSEGSLDQNAKRLASDPNAVLVFGGCEYIDPLGRAIWVNRSGKWAVKLLRFGPDLIPQPGALFRKQNFLKVGGLDSRFSWAFDFDLFIKLSQSGRVLFVDKTLASFRWHPESLSVEFRKKSVKEAHAVRTQNLPGLLRPFSFLWEYPVMILTLLAGFRISKLAKLPS